MKILLSELYAIDSTLEEHEEELVGVLERFMEARPDIQIDPVFVARLRAELTATERSQPFITRIIHTMTTKRFLVGSGAVAVAVIIAVVALKPTVQDFSQTSLQQPSSGLIGLAPGAFGNLSGVRADGDQASALGRGSAASAPTAGAATDEAAVAESLPPVGYGGGGGFGLTAEGKMMVPPISATIAVTYVGDDLTLEESAAPVYRRITDNATAESLGRMFAGADNGLFEAKTLQSLKLGMIQMSEDVDDGFIFSLDLNNGNLSVYQNYARMERAERDYGEVRFSDKPSDSEIIAAADAFIRSYGIALDGYGEPFMDVSWMQYRADEDGAVEWIPPTLSVIYPQLVEGTEIIEMGGEVAGAHVAVDIRTREVMNVSNVMLASYERSQYALETDPARIISLLENGGVYGPIYWHGMSGDDVPTEVSYGTPDRVLVKYFHYDETTGRNNELYIPALRFPATNDGGVVYRPYIVVPLVKDILDAYESRFQNDNGVTPVPLMRSEPGMGAPEPAVMVEAVEIPAVETGTE